LKTKKDWLNHTKSKKFPKDIPVSLLVYDEWVNSTEFFGPRPPRPSNYRSFEKVKKYAKSHNIKTKDEWFKHTKSKNLPKDIPVSVRNCYKENWVSWPDFLGKKSK
jgi:hypothetical protein